MFLHSHIFSYPHTIVIRPVYSPRTVMIVARRSCLGGVRLFSTHYPIIDLRSDTVTRPTPAMHAAMAKAMVGDDVFEDDPTVISLQNHAANVFEKEASLFFPTGTMCNLTAVMGWCTDRFSEVILGSKSHIFLSENGGVAHLGGVSMRALTNQVDGTIALPEVRNSIRDSSNVHNPHTRLICLEDTHNHCGGRVLPDGYMSSVRDIASKYGLPIHLDGARIWNASEATGRSVAHLTKHADTVSVCLSKGLGAPAGSLLLGPKAFIDSARRTRKALGGGMRQVGILAAAGRVAMDDFAAGILRDDHRRATQLAEALAKLPDITLNVNEVESNIIIFKAKDASSLLRELKQQGVLAIPFGGDGCIRLVVHRDISDEDIDRSIDVLRKTTSH